MNEGTVDPPLDVSGFVSDVLTDWQAVIEAKEEAATVALWAFMEKQRTSPWRWLRLRYLEQVWQRMTAQYDALDAALARHERRAEVAEQAEVRS